MIVVVGCALLYSLPLLWPFYNLQLYPRVLPWILPAVQGRNAKFSEIDTQRSNDGRSVFDITDFDITESDITNLI